MKNTCDHRRYYSADSTMRYDEAPCPFCIAAERDALRAERDSIIAVTCRVKEERDALRAVLREIVIGYQETYSLEVNLGGISDELIERAEKLLGGES